MIKRINSWIFKPRPERLVSIYPTFKCNLNCLYCGRQYDIEKPEDGLTNYLQWIDIIGKYNVNSVRISGGEPMLYRDITLLINSLLEDKYYVRLVTNLIVNDISGVLPNPRFRILATYHKDSMTNKQKERFILNYHRYKKDYLIDVRELGLKTLPFTRITKPINMGYNERIIKGILLDQRGKEWRYL